MTFINGALADKASFAVAVETTPGVLTGTPDWTTLEVNSISDFGDTISTTERSPLSADRMRRKGGVTGLDSAVSFDTDLTYSMFDLFSQGFFFASWNAQTTFTPTAVTATGYTVPSGGALDDGVLVYARGYSNSTNNGLHIVSSASATEVSVSDTLVADASPATGSRLDVVGVQATTGDITMDSDGNLNSTSLDFTTLGIQVGQWIYVGGSDTDTFFNDGGTVKSGEARVQIVAANKLTFDKTPSGFTTDAGTGKTIQLFIGSFIKNVPYSSGSFLTETYTFEVQYDTLTNKYHYPNGNYANEMAISMSMEDKATVSYSFIGLDTPVPTSVRETGNWYDLVDTTMLNTSSDVARLEIKTSDGTSIVDVGESLIQDLTVTLTNNVTPKKGIGTLGTVLVALGNFNVDISATMYLDSSQAIVSIRNNDTVGLDFSLHNDDGGLHFDIPSMTIGDGSRDFPAGDTINMSLTGMAFKDSFYEFALGCTKYPYLPI